jgi:uncharacterized membrane protein YdjX (TVP38/TMEM64 family)
VKRALWLIAGVAISVIATKVLLEDVAGVSLDGLATRWITDAGAAGAVTIALLLAVDIVLPVPSSLVMVLSGAAFGVWWGTLLALAGSIAGEWLGFELARRFGVGISTRLIGATAMADMRGVMARHGVEAVLVTRALPVVMETTSIVAGLSAMRRSTFLLTSLVGTVPVAAAYACAGAWSREVSSIVPAIVILLAVTAAGWAWYRARLAP